jgi:putative oxidoreductase
MLVASLMQHWGDSWNMLPAAGFGWVVLFTMILGSGRFGIDYLISKKWNNEKL